LRISYCCCRRRRPLPQLLYDTFSAFGVIINTPKLMRDPDTGNSKGFGFVSYDCFEASDAAIEAMNGQYLCNRQITVSYAYKKDTKGEPVRAVCTLDVLDPCIADIPASAIGTI
jgi:RNA recognition motif-containing protein